MDLSEKKEAKTSTLHILSYAQLLFRSADSSHSLHIVLHSDYFGSGTKLDPICLAKIDF
jgi:hypothetical protein